ncbi:MAG: thioredoxin-dependent thiol peroxidase [Paludibacteraceae bacterium]
MVLKVGDKFPDVLGMRQDGKMLKMSDFAGRKVVLYFYPKDNTSGCTAEACSLRDNYAALRAQGYEVVGVSTDSAASHTKFIQKNALPFDLIADTDKQLSETVGTWGEKTMCGRKYMGMLRTTFLIDENGIVEKIFLPKEIKTASHGNQILDIV